MKYKFLILTLIAISGNVHSRIDFKKIGDVPDDSSVIDPTFFKVGRIMVSTEDSWRLRCVSGPGCRLRDPYTSYGANGYTHHLCTEGVVASSTGITRVNVSVGPASHTCINGDCSASKIDMTASVAGQNIPPSGLPGFDVDLPMTVKLCYQVSNPKLAIQNKYADLLYTGDQILKVKDPNGRTDEVRLTPQLRYDLRAGANMPAAISVTPTVLNLTTSDGRYDAPSVIKMRGGPGTLTITSDKDVTINGDGPTSSYTQRISGWSPKDVLEGRLVVSGTVPVGQTVTNLRLTRQFA